ncbi:peptide chain release factor N(5)-glutamine methyltransferase [Buchnera aphidicola]|uniref:peptide chain release factor N(5)-glutamine methyltransferase n=1 Tax=Buchnera aphidicola TaxID=9 RepID=UPI0031B82F28
MYISDCLKHARRLLSGCKVAQLEAEILLSFVIKKSLVWIKLFDNYQLNEMHINLFNKLLNRRIYGEPIAYIIKNKEFWSLSFYISSLVFIPRPETELLVEKVIDFSCKKNCILDLGSGCGTISLSLAHDLPNCNILGVDNNDQAIFVSRKNLNRFKLKNVIFKKSNWFSKIKKKFHLIVSNPPYLSKIEYYTLYQGKFFEPYTAFVSGKNGISDIEHIIFYARKYLFNTGWLFIEHGWQQKNIVQQLFKINNYYNIQTYQDYFQYDRFTIGQYICENYKTNKYW